MQTPCEKSKLAMWKGHQRRTEANAESPHQLPGMEMSLSGKPCPVQPPDDCRTNQLHMKQKNHPAEPSQCLTLCGKITLLLEATAFCMVCYASHKKNETHIFQNNKSKPFDVSLLSCFSVNPQAIANIGFLIAERIFEAELKLKASLLTLKHLFFPPHLRG